MTYPDSIESELKWQKRRPTRALGSGDDKLRPFGAGTRGISVHSRKEIREVVNRFAYGSGGQSAATNCSGGLVILAYVSNYTQCVGIILAGGTGSRLHPCTTVTNKHLLPVGEMPMIFYPLKKLVAAGIEDILIVTGTEHMGDFISLLGSGSEFDCALTYRVQDEASGIADALSLAERFARDQPMCVILGDNIFENSIANLIRQFSTDPTNAHIMLKEVPDAERFGVAEVDGERIVRIIEKPEVPPSSLAVTGIYCYPPDVFDIIRTLEPSERGELEITDVNNSYLDQGRLRAAVFDGYWSDAGTFPSLARANELVQQTPPRF